MSKPVQPSSLGLRQIDLLQGLAPERFDAIGRQCAWLPFAASTSFGELAAIDGRPRSADVVALTPGLLASMPPRDFKELLRGTLASGRLKGAPVPKPLSYLFSV